jgi:hypothetical protein
VAQQQGPVACGDGTLARHYGREIGATKWVGLSATVPFSNYSNIFQIDSNLN